MKSNQGKKGAHYDPWKDATVLVTGASGFIGGHLTRSLTSKGATVHGSSRQARASADEPTHWHTLDLQHVDDVYELFRSLRPEFVFHLSALATGSQDRSLVLPTFRAEVVSTVNVLLASTECGCRNVILPASLEEPQGSAPPNSPYAAAKAATRLYASMFHALYETPVRLARIYMAYGPGQSSTKVVPQLIRSLLRGESPVLVSPRRLVDWIYIDDVVDGLLAIAAKEDLDGQSFELGSGQLVSIEDVALRLQALVNPNLQLLATPTRSRESEIERRADLGPTEEKTGWRPLVSLDDGLRRTLDRYRAQEGSMSA